MVKANYMRQGRVLVPVDDMAMEALTAIKDGREIVIDIRASRNPRHHRLFFAMLRKVVDAGAWEGDVDSLKRWVKLKCFLVNNYFVDGRLVTEIKSIRFEAMSQARFNRFFDRAAYHICQGLLGGHDWVSFRDEIIEMVDGPYRDYR